MNLQKTQANKIDIQHLNLWDVEAELLLAARSLAILISKSRIESTLDSGSIAVKVFGQTYELQPQIYTQLVQPINQGSQVVNTQRILDTLIHFMNWPKEGSLTKFGLSALSLYPGILYANSARIPDLLMVAFTNGWYSVIIRILKNSCVLETILRLPNKDRVLILSQLVKIGSTKDYWIQLAQTLYSEDKITKSEMEFLWVDIPRNTQQVKEEVKERVSTTAKWGFTSNLRKILSSPIPNPFSRWESQQEKFSPRTTGVRS